MNTSLHVACAHCDALNRMPADRLRDGARCGRCGEAVFSGRPVQLDSTNFELHAGRSDLPLLVDFWAPWCGPCRSMAPAFEAAAGLLEPEIRLGKVNTEDEQALAARFGIRSIPTLVLLRGGRELARQAGATNAQAIVQWARTALAAARP